MISNFCDRVSFFMGAAACGTIAVSTATLGTVTLSTHNICKDIIECTNSTAFTSSSLKCDLIKPYITKEFTNLLNDMDGCEAIFTISSYLTLTMLVTSVATLHLTYRALCYCNK